MTDDHRPSVDGPTAMSPTSGHLDGGLPEEPAAEATEPDTPTPVDQPAGPVPPSVDGPTVAAPVLPGVDGPTLAEPVVSGVDEPTLAMVGDEPTGPIVVGGWPFDEFEPPSGEPVAPAQPRASRSPAYYVALGAAVVLVVGLVAVAAFVTVRRPQHEVAGSATAAVPQITNSSTPSPSTTTQTRAQSGPFAELAAHPLSSSTARMPDVTCALPRFDPADDRQAAFYTAAKKCADDAWRPVLQAAGLEGEVKVVTVTGAVQTQSCGELAPTSAPTECDGTVYLAPAYLRDTERLGRYPGKYFGIFLREYARGLQFSTGLDDLVTKVTTGSAADLDTKVDQQATCLAGVAGGAMAGRGAVDTNITNEIHQRLTTVDAPPDAQALLDKGFQQRTPAACNTWKN